MQFVYIDTVGLSGNSDVHDPETHELLQELNGSELPGPEDAGLADAQMEWLEHTLATSTAQYLVVAGHYPIYSICEHGPTSGLVERVKPLLEQYKVTAYLNGHDHCMQHLVTANQEGQAVRDGVDYHTVGSAAINDPSEAHKDVEVGGVSQTKSLKFHSPGKQGGFATVTVTRQGLSLTHYDGDGSVLYTAPPHRPRDAAYLEAVAAPGL